MSIFQIVVLFVCFNVPIYILVRHFGAKREESKHLVILSILSCINWALLIGLFSFFFFAAKTNSFLNSLAIILVVLAVLLSATILLIKAVELYKE